MTATPRSAALPALLAAPAREVAPLLLGAQLRSITDLGAVTVEITEVEAYEGESDPASHAWRGQSARNAIMFGPAGHLYVYRSHGLHWCLNIVTGTAGTASAVLLRAGRVVEGEDIAYVRRGAELPHARLARGPGCLAKALGVTGALSGADVTVAASPILLTLPARPEPDIAQGPRVGVSKAAEVPWRWWIAGDPTVSAYRRSPHASPGTALS